jgi:DDE_Tnp_1-associated
MDTPNAIEQRFSSVAVVHAPRRQHPTTHHSLEARLILTLLATLCGAHHGVDIEPWGAARTVWLSQLLQRPHGIPSPETFGRVFCRFHPARLPQAFVSWRSALAALGEEIMARDGKTIRRALARADGKGPMHGVSAWASRHELGLAQCQVDAKSHELTARPALLSMRTLEGRVVTLAARGCHVESAGQMIDHGAEEVRSWQENPPGVYEEGAQLFAWLNGPPASDEEIV